MTHVIAEIGINHNGDMSLARKMIEEAARSGADAVKFQNYSTEDFIVDKTLTYSYENQGKKVIGFQVGICRRLQSRNCTRGVRNNQHLRNLSSAENWRRPRLMRGCQRVYAPRSFGLCMPYPKRN